METKYISDMVRSLFTLLFAVSMMYVFLECKDTEKKKRYRLRIYAVGVLLLDGIILINFGYLKFMKLYPLLVQLPVFLGFVYASKFNIAKVFFVHLTAVAIALSMALMGLEFNHYFNIDRIIMNAISSAMYIPLWLILYRYMGPSIRYMLNNTEKGWIGFCTIPLTYTFLIYMASRYNLDYEYVGAFARNAMLIFALTLASYILILRIFRQTSEQLKLQNEQNLLEMQVAAARSHLESLKESQDITIIHRHDMHHHLELINGYLEENETKAAQKYISEVEKSIESTVVERYCENYSLNLILYHYISKMKDIGVTVESEINLSEKILISDMDLCIIFSNILENAGNALSAITSMADKTLEIVCKNRESKLLIQVTNNYSGSILFEDEMPVSKKENHGMGTKSIVAVVEKYFGVYSFTAEDGIFKTRIII